MRILMLSTKYPVERGQSWMSSDLGDALVRRGHQVDVVLIDWNADVGRSTRSVTTDGGVDVLDIAPRAVERFGKLAYKISKMLLSPRHAAREMKTRIDPADYDLLIAFTPASTLAAPIRYASAIARRILFIFDFYPVYQREIGLVPPGTVYSLALRREEKLYRGFSQLVCNLPGNISYLRRNYRLRDGQKITSHPLWSDVTAVDVLPRDEVRQRYGLPDDRPIAIFGGQITDGRGVELMLDAARLAREAQSPLFFLFVGDGRLAEMVDRASNSGNVKRIANVSRDDYLQIAGASDVGLVATVPGVSSFNFPTKTIDYLRVQLPVVAAVEPGNDYSEILTGHGVGMTVDYTDPKSFFRTAERLATDEELRREMPARARICLDEVFDVERAADMALGVQPSTGR